MFEYIFRDNVVSINIWLQLLLQRCFSGITFVFLVDPYY